ncbi:hypothetical protein V6N12_068743 [Hibiscus sabdariffa]|uniref:Uncharacterized protein n=1 Tax=Hibiscus sabdariffa TaxID=183260 RepID=A0ABR2FQV4_9ROSI
MHGRVRPKLLKHWRNKDEDMKICSRLLVRSCPAYEIDRAEPDPNFSVLASFRSHNLKVSLPCEIAGSWSHHPCSGIDGRLLSFGFVVKQQHNCVSVTLYLNIQ